MTYNRVECHQCEIRQALIDMVEQFAYRGMRKGRLVLWTGGLSALEGAFKALGWEDNHPYPEGECEVRGCHGDAKAIGPTRRKLKAGKTLDEDRYTHLCDKHYREE